MLLLCSVMSAVSVSSKNSLEMLDDFRHSGVVWGCISAHKQKIGHIVCAEGSFRTRSTGQDIDRIYIHIVASVGLIISYWSNKFQSPSHKSHFLNVNFSTTLSTFTRNPAALYALSNIRGT